MFNLFKKKEFDELGNPIDNKNMNDDASNSVVNNIDKENASFRMVVRSVVIPPQVFALTARPYTIDAKEKVMVRGTVEVGTLRKDEKVIVCGKNGAYYEVLVIHTHRSIPDEEMKELESINEEELTPEQKKELSDRIFKVSSGDNANLMLTSESAFKIDIGDVIIKQ